MLTVANKDGQLPLHVACQSGARENTIELIGRDYDHAAQTPDKDMMLPLHYACANGGSLETIKLLMFYYSNACLSENANGATPLHLAIRAQRPKAIIKKLLSAGGLGALAAKDKAGNTPLHISSYVATGEDVVELLCNKWGAAKEDENDAGFTPYDIAKRTRPKEKKILKLLKPETVGI